MQDASKPRYCVYVSTRIGCLFHVLANLTDYRLACEASSRSAGKEIPLMEATGSSLCSQEPSSLS
jgi:hypothetical protein